MSEHAMNRLGTALTPDATKVMVLGCGELGKEVVIELQRLGVEVVAVDRYANAPAMQVAHRSHVIDMLDVQRCSKSLNVRLLTSWCQRSKPLRRRRWLPWKLLAQCCAYRYCDPVNHGSRRY